jgi:very-short-patch-repair endonuclease
MPATPESSQVNMTDAENRLWTCLCAADLGTVEFHPQHVVGEYTVDFCAPQEKLIIEVDDPQALEHDEFYVIRNAWLKAEGWRLLRFTSHDVLKNTEGVSSVILAVVRKSGKAAIRSAGKSLEGIMDFEI